MRNKCVMMYVLLFVLMTARAGMGVEITNGDFENGFTDWRYYGVSGAVSSFTIVNDAYTGSSAASMEVISFAGGDTALDRDSKKIAVSSGDAIKFSFAAKKISTGATRLMFAVAEYSAAGAFLGIQSNFFAEPGNSAYGEYSFVYFVRSPDAAAVNIGFRILDNFGLMTTGHYYIDSVAVSETDRIYNGGFEEGDAGWRAYMVGGVANFGLSNDAYEGSNAYSMEIINPGIDSGLDRWFSKFPVKVGEVIGLSAATKKIAAGDNILKMIVSEWNDTDTFLGQGEFLLSSGTGSYNVTDLGYVVGNPATTRLNVGFSIVSSGGAKVAGHYLIDDVKTISVARIYNGGFESGLFGWRGYAVAGGEGTFTLSSDAYEGDNAILMDITNPAGDHGLDRYGSMAAVDPNETITLSFAAKRVSADEKTLRLTISEWDINGAYLGNHNLFDFKPTTSGYDVYESTYKVTNPACAKVNVGFGIYTADLSAKSTGQMLIDSVKIINAQYITNYSFEKNYDYWRYYAVGGAIADYTISTDAYEGNYAALMTVTTAGLDQALDRNDSKIPVAAGDKILVSFAAKNASGADTLLLLNVAEFDSAGNYLAKYGLKFFNPSTNYGVYNFYYTVQDAAAGFINIAFTIFNSDGSVKSTGSYLIDAVHVVKAHGMNDADVNYDLVINADDVQVVAENWLDDTTVVGDTLTVDNFEGYADQGALTAKWQEFYWASFNGSTTTSNVTLLTNAADAYEGSRAMRWVYDANDISGDGLNFTDVVLTFDSPIDMTNAQSVKINLNRHAGNSQEYLLYVKFFTGAVDVANISGQGIWLTRDNGSTYSPTGWSEWTANLDDLIDYNKSQLGAVSAMLIGCFSPELDGTSGTGTIDIDNIRVVNADSCASELIGDINGDCKVNLLDMVALANNWLVEIVY